MRCQDQVFRAAHRESGQEPAATLLSSTKRAERPAGRPRPRESPFRPGTSGCMREEQAGDQWAGRCTGLPGRRGHGVGRPSTVASISTAWRTRSPLTVAAGGAGSGPRHPPGSTSCWRPTPFPQPFKKYRSNWTDAAFTWPRSTPMLGRSQGGVGGGSGRGDHRHDLEKADACNYRRQTFMVTTQHDHC